MMRKFRPKDLEKMLRSMGVRVQTLDAEEVLIRLRDGTALRISDPQISVTKVGGEEIYQVMGRVEKVSEVEEKGEEVYEPTEEDISLVASQAGVDRETARKALIEAGGDLAEAILRLTEGAT